MKNTNCRYIFAILVFSILSLTITSSSMGQCGGVYFNPRVRAVNKHFGMNGNFFRLDDWTGDGKLDFWNFQTDPGSPVHNVFIYPSRAAGYWDFENPIIYSTSIPSSNSLEFSLARVVDFNVDGRMDLFYVDRVHRNNGSGSLIPLVNADFSDPAVSTHMDTLGFVDLNGDTLPDWLYVSSVHPTGQEIRYQAAAGDGSFLYRTIVAAHSPQRQLNNFPKAIGDFDGDGDIDIVFNTYVDGAYAHVFLKNLVGGSFDSGTVVPGAGNSVYDDVADLNNDGRADIVSRTVGTNRLFVLYGQASGLPNQVEYPVANAFTDRFQAAELDGNNNTDIIGFTATKYSVFINNGTGGFARSDYSRKDSSSSLYFVIEDFSGDNKADVYAEIPSVTGRSGSGGNAFGEPLLVISDNSCSRIPNLRGPDFGAGETFDIMTWNPNSGRWSTRDAIWLFESPPAAFFNWGSGALGDVPAPGDFDGDERTDYSVYRRSTGEWYIRKSSDSSWLVFRFGLSGDIAIPNDYDGGGKTDIAVFRPSDGNWHLFYTETQQYEVVHFGANGDKPVPADYDGDGKTDIGVYRPSEGNWYYARSSDQGIGIIRWGINSDVPVPADYDGDGKADLAVFREGTWYILRSLNGTAAVLLWGSAGDTAVPVYRNGFSADVVISRPPQGWWYNYRFSGPPTSAILLGGSGHVPVYYGLPNN